MKKRLFQIVGNIIIAVLCAIPVGFLAESQNEGYKYYYNLFISKSDPQLLIMANWYISRCWLIIGCGTSVTVLLMSVYSLFLRVNSRKHNVMYIIMSMFLAGIVFGLNQLLGGNASLQSLLNIINPILIYSFIGVFGIASYLDYKKKGIQISQ